ncbi:hypothetical protein [Limnoglobus roseus]|uniref:hypothetical protein n=1 Tax=Limnoglobus roseus TaxID=2598579 RepID=UPI0011EB7D22|nr:hypothetical protein [Limnoglobus roseus]
MVVFSTRWLCQQFDKSALFSALSPDVVTGRFKNDATWEGRSDWQLCSSLGRPDNVVPAEKCDVFFFLPPRAYVKVYIYNSIDLAAYIDRSGTVVATDVPVRKIARQHSLD